jgi:FKBP-type peptidyl-prolyl cis-trans isomerase
MMKKIAPLLLLAASLIIFGCKESSQQANQKRGTQEQIQALEKTAPIESGKAVITASGLSIQDLVVGTGAIAEAGKTVSVHCTGWLMDGQKFDSSVDRGEPFIFQLGASRVIKGWDEGVAGMKVGGKRILLIPPELGDGERGAGGVIPPNAVLKFEVELLDVK